MEPTSQDLGLAAHDLLHLGLELLLLGHHRDPAELGQLGRGSQPGRYRLGFGSHDRSTRGQKLNDTGQDTLRVGNGLNLFTSYHSAHG